MANQVELFCDQGTDFSFTLDIANDDGTPVNVAGYTLTSAIRKSYYSTNATANMVVTVLTAANGNLQLSMNSATTTNIKAGRYLYDVKMVSDANVTSRVMEGIITIYPQITK